MHRFGGVLLICLTAGCAATPVRPPPPGAAGALDPKPVGTAPATAAALPASKPDTDSATCQAAIGAPASDPAAVESATEEDDGPDAEGETAAVEEEGESHEATSDAFEGNRYTADLSDEQLAAEWKSNPELLGSISIGFVDEGRMINSVQFPCGEGWIVVSPERAYGTQETIDYVRAAIQQVRLQYPDSLPLRVNQISSKDGGYLRPHKSHQSGRDVDLAFYYPTVEPVRAREREKVIDVKRTWALLRAVVTQTDVQMVLLDQHVQKVLYDYALATGDDKAWLDSIFHAGKDSIVKHARRHRDHMHVRFFNGRAQELGRRVAPLLAQRPEQNLVFHRVRSGDTLGALARRYGTSVEGLRKANRIKGSMLHLAQVLKVPLRGPCTHCPIPPAVFVPGRRLPPQLATAQVAPAVGGSAIATATPSAAVVPAMATRVDASSTQGAVQGVTQTVAQVAAETTKRLTAEAGARPPAPGGPVAPTMAAGGTSAAAGPVTAAGPVAPSATSTTATGPAGTTTAAVPATAATVTAPASTTSPAPATAANAAATVSHSEPTSVAPSASAGSAAPRSSAPSLAPALVTSPTAIP